MSTSLLSMDLRQQTLGITPGNEAASKGEGELRSWCVQGSHGKRGNETVAGRSGGARLFLSTSGSRDKQTERELTHLGRSVNLLMKDAFPGSPTGLYLQHWGSDFNQTSKPQHNVRPKISDKQEEFPFLLLTSPVNMNDCNIVCVCICVCVCLGLAVFPHRFHIIGILLKPSERGETRIISSWLLMKNPRFRELNAIFYWELRRCDCRKRKKERWKHCIYIKVTLTTDCHNKLVFPSWLIQPAGTNSQGK